MRRLNVLVIVISGFATYPVLGFPAPKASTKSPAELIIGRWEEVPGSQKGNCNWEYDGRDIISRGPLSESRAPYSIQFDNGKPLLIIQTSKHTTVRWYLEFISENEIRKTDKDSHDTLRIRRMLTVP